MGRCSGVAAGMAVLSALKVWRAAKAEVDFDLWQEWHSLGSHLPAFLAPPDNSQLGIILKVTLCSHIRAQGNVIASFDLSYRLSGPSK